LIAGKDNRGDNAQTFYQLFSIYIHKKDFLNARRIASYLQWRLQTPDLTIRKYSKDIIERVNEFISSNQS